MVTEQPCFAPWDFLVLKLSTKMDMPQRGRIHLYSFQVLPIFVQEGQEYLSLLGIHMRYHTPCQDEICSPSLLGGYMETLGAQGTPWIAAQPPSSLGEWSSSLLVNLYLVLISSLLGTPTLPYLSFIQRVFCW